MGMCEGFTDSNGDRRRRSIVLAPIKVRVEGGSFTLTWTCNLAENCHNKECFYAKSKSEKPSVEEF
jgi:hypothetical protein